MDERRVDVQCLPAEILERVFHLLRPRCRKVVVQVCRWWREVGEAPVLWTWVTLTVRTSNLATMVRVLNTRRMGGVRRVQVRAVSEELLQAITSHSSLRVINMANMDMVRLVDLSATEQKMKQSCLTCPHVTTLLTALVKTPMLQKLNLSRHNLSSVGTGVLLALFVNMLEEVDLTSTSLTTPQLTSIFMSILDRMKLRKLNLSYNKLSSVKAGLLAAAVGQLVEVDLPSTKLTPYQLTALFSSVEVSGRLKRLNISENNLSSMEPVQLASAASKLEEFEVEGACLTHTHVEAIFVLRGFSKLRRISMDNNNLSLVNPTTIARGVNKLERVSMECAFLTGEQINAILGLSLEGTCLRQLTTWGLREEGEVDQELLLAARRVIQHIDL